MGYGQTKIENEQRKQDTDIVIDGMRIVNQRWKDDECERWERDKKRPTMRLRSTLKSLGTTSIC